ncbi:MAG: hypothetical protein ACR2KQ_00860 [Actinomycetota bacterium]
MVPSVVMGQVVIGARIPLVLALPVLAVPPVMPLVVVAEVMMTVAHAAVRGVGRQAGIDLFRRAERPQDRSHEQSDGYRARNEQCPKVP